MALRINTLSGNPLLNDLYLNNSSWRGSDNLPSFLISPDDHSAGMIENTDPSVGMASRKFGMEKKEIKTEKLFQEFQSSFMRASPEEQKSLAARFYPWAEHQANTLGVTLPDTTTGNSMEDHEHSALAVPGTFLPENRQNLLMQDMQDRVETEIHLRQIAENIEQVCWLRDIHSGEVLYVSPAFNIVWGRSCESLYSNSSVLIDSVHPEDRVQVMVARPHNDHKPFNQTYRILRPDGGLRWIFSRTFLVNDKTGEPFCQFCVAQDITDQKQVELALRKTLNRSREQFDLSRRMSLARKPEIVLKTLMSADELRSAQRAALLFFDHPKIGPSRGVELRATWLSSQNLSPWLSETNLYEEPALWELFQPNRTVTITDILSDPRLTPSIRGFLQEGQIQSIVIFPLVASGDWLGCLLVYFEQEHFFDHIELRHLRVLIDQATITLYNLQLLEVEESSRHEAERANEIKTEFLAMISHELRTPLTSIIGFTTTLLADDVTWEPDETRDFIQTIQQEANRLHELIDHLLDLSRLEAGMLPISMEPHLLPEIIDDALPQLQILTREHKLTMHLPANLPPVNADIRRIAQVLVNLVKNASTYAPKGTEINISASVRGEFVQININDQGSGIPPAEHKRVFKAFERGANDEYVAQGAGLGLAICKGLVEAHGGRIWIKRKNTPGATISFTIPLAPLRSQVNPVDQEK
jgi:PAS domain S-box-containing protein